MSVEAAATDHQEQPQYVVVTTSHPTTYGCNRGIAWTKAELVARTSREVSAGPYATREEAVRAARGVRNRSNYFADACEPDPEDCSDAGEGEAEADDDAGGGSEYIFTNTDMPPYCSSALENWDNDDEEIIDVMTQKKLEDLEAKDQAFLKKETLKRRYEYTVKNAVTKLQIQDSGAKVHYSTPQQPYDVVAEVEIVEEDARDHPSVVKFMDADAVAARGTEVPDNASRVRSLMYRGGEKRLLELSRTCLDVDYGKAEAKAKVEEDGANHPLLRILSACTSLEELYIKGECRVGPCFVEQLLTAAPHLRRTLKVLSLALLDVNPEALPALGEFKALERLDLMSAFSGEHFQPSFDHYDDYGYGGGRVQEMDLPYDKDLMKMVESLPTLKRLDIGHGSDISFLYEYILSPYALSDAKRHLESQRGRVTTDERNQPEPWSSKVREEAARQEALVAIMNDGEEDAAIREMAEEEAMLCSVCQKSAKKRCTGCKRTWYCSVDCQRNDYKKKHKRLCKEVF